AQGPGRPPAGDSRRSALWPPEAPPPRSSRSARGSTPARSPGSSRPQSPSRTAAAARGRSRLAFGIGARTSASRHAVSRRPRAATRATSGRPVLLLPVRLELPSSRAPAREESPCCTLGPAETLALSRVRGSLAFCWTLDFRRMNP
ncbi:wiskott-Aldrich syndrome protein homolog 1-like, partial [Heterocephalus glaber]|uniref:Wiskott-Aldrich syndrome protein homolog 1-like n=1 Tax=Heterocephalus glaber TaxID=10181 RepID=A0AAX6T494_HETGA